jgi:hypothetical protein
MAKCVTVKNTILCNHFSDDLGKSRDIAKGDQMEELPRITREIRLRSGPA